MSNIQEDQADPKPGQRVRRRRRWMGLWVLLSGFFAAVFLGLVVMSWTGRVLQAPDWVTRYVENQINSGFTDGRMQVGDIQLNVNRAGLPEFAMRNMGVFAQNGSEIARLNFVSAGFSPIQILQAKPHPSHLKVRGAEITLRRQKDGQFALSFGDGTGATSNMAGLIDNLDAVFSKAPLHQVKTVQATDLTITIEDARTARLWQVTDGQLNVHRTETGLDISVEFEVFNGTEELAKIVIGIGTEFESSHATMGIQFDNAAAQDIAAQSPALSFLAVLDAPISGALRADYDADGNFGNLAGTLGAQNGALTAGDAATPLVFKSAKTYFSYDPDKQALGFTGVSLESETVNLQANGQAYLQKFTDGWPGALVGQFNFTDSKVNPANLYPKPLTLEGLALDFRLQLDPFSVDIGQVVVTDGPGKLVGSGNLAPADGGGWSVGGKLEIDTIERQDLLDLWPPDFVPGTRDWIENRMLSGAFSKIQFATRTGLQSPGKRLVSWDFSDTSINYADGQPPLENASGYATINGNVLTLVLENGTITPPIGPDIDLSGSVFHIPDISKPPATAEIRLAGVSEIQSVLSLMDLPPFNVLERAPFGPDVATGTTEFTANVKLPLIKKVELSDVKYALDAALFDVNSDKIVPDRIITAERLQFHADNAGSELSGPAKLGNVQSDLIWRQLNAPDSIGQSMVSGTVELSQLFVDEFNIGLPSGAVSGTGIGQFDIIFEEGNAPRYTLSSDLNRIGLRFDQVGWAKPKNAIGRLWVAGQLGEHLAVTSLELKTSGLDAAGGRVGFTSDNNMESVRFERVRLDGWLDAPVEFVARTGASPLIRVTGGTLDIRETTFGGGQGGSSGGSTGGGPLIANFDRVIISDGISLTSFKGELDTSGGLSGGFTARLNEKTRLNGRLGPSENGTAVQIFSANGGGMLRNAGIVEYAEGGDMTLILTPRKKNGRYAGELLITSTSVKNAPGMTELLSAVSIVGLLEQLDGGGISFDSMEADFILTPTFVNLTKSSAVGPSLGISLEGVYDMTLSEMDMQGVVSPVYFLNSIGEVLTRKGEGLFGFNYTIKGSSDDPIVNVNPLSILTPGGLRDIFRAPSKATP